MELSASSISLYGIAGVPLLRVTRVILTAVILLPLLLLPLPNLLETGGRTATAQAPVTATAMAPVTMVVATLIATSLLLLQVAQAMTLAATMVKSKMTTRPMALQRLLAHPRSLILQHLIPRIDLPSPDPGEEAPTRPTLTIRVTLLTRTPSSTMLFQVTRGPSRRPLTAAWSTET